LGRCAANDAACDAADRRANRAADDGARNSAAGCPGHNAVAVSEGERGQGRDGQR
jgi:hypothetical protein